MINFTNEFNSGSTGNWTRGRTNTITTSQSVAQFKCTARDVLKPYIQKWTRNYTNYTPTLSGHDLLTILGLWNKELWLAGRLRQMSSCCEEF